MRLRILTGLLLASSMFAAPITLVVRPALGPDPFNPSPSFAPYVANVLAGLSACGASAAPCSFGGSIDVTPTAFNETHSILASDIVLTAFNSWRGVAPPVGAAFAGEFGTALYWALYATVTDPMDTFSLSDLTVMQSSSDPFNFFMFSDTYAADSYAFDRVGIHWGADGAPGGGDDTVYMGGEAGTNPIHQFLFVGISFGYDSSIYAGTPAEILAQAIADGNTLTPSTILTCYDIQGNSSCTDVTQTPEPGSAVLLSGGLAALYWFRRRRKLTS